MIGYQLSDSGSMRMNRHYGSSGSGGSVIPTPQIPLYEHLKYIGGNFTVSTFFYESVDGSIYSCPLSTSSDIMRIEYIDTTTNTKLNLPKFTFQLGAKNRGEWESQHHIFKRWYGGFWIDNELLPIFRLADSDHLITQAKNANDVNDNRYYSSSITDSRGNPIIPPYYFQGYFRTYCEPMEQMDSFRKQILGGNMFGGGRAWFQWFEVVADSEIAFSYYWTGFKQYYRNKYFTIELARA